MVDEMISGGPQAACRDCGEMVREGLVRCWNCGAFTDPEVEARFLKMQSDKPAVIYSDPTAAEADDSTFATAGAEANASDPDMDAGFELNIGSKGVDLLEGLGDSGDESKTVNQESPQPTVPEKEPEDEVLAAAMSDLKETAARNENRLRDGFAGGVKTAGGFIIFCPYGCKIEVKEKHRGQIGKCPKCRAPFMVPVDPPDYIVAPTATDETAAEGDTAASKAVGAYSLWLEDASLHTVDPERLKLKAGSLQKDFSEFDLFIADDHLALVPLVDAKGRPLKKGPKRDEQRQKAKDAATAGPFKAKFLEADVLKLDADQVRSLKVVQPTKSRGDSMFAGVAVFGEGRIGVQLPEMADRDKPDVLSFTLTEFRRFSQTLGDLYGMSGFGADVDIPLEDEAFEHTCHFSDAKIKALDKLDFYRADPDVELILAGHQCAACGVVISEDSRKKEGIGGKSPKGVPKAKCPKCSEKMGDLPLYTRKELVEDAQMQSET